MPSSVLPFPYRGDPGVRGSSGEQWFPEHPARVRLLPVAEVQQRIDARRAPEPVVERHGYAPPARHRLVGLIGTAMVFALVLAGFALSISTAPPVHAPAAPTVVELLPLTATPEVAPAKPVEVPPGPEQHEQQPQKPATPATLTAQELPLVPSAAPVEATSSSGGHLADQAAQTSAANARLVEQTTAPPSPSGGNNAMADWQGQLLGHLKTFRRYPRQAESARQQGIVLVGITVDRNGQLLKANIRQASGYPLLDAEALATVRRASPLPPPTAEIPGDPVIAEIPVQFSLRR